MIFPLSSFVVFGQIYQNSFIIHYQNCNFNSQISVSFFYCFNSRPIRALFFVKIKQKEFFCRKEYYCENIFLSTKKKSSKTFFVQKKNLKKFLRNNDKFFVLLSDKKGIHCLFFFSKTLTRIFRKFLQQDQKHCLISIIVFFFLSGNCHTLH
ncbi:hypothetical protein RFI_35026 [Reticulomyxa filosa]|uniref:Uncharacterized protein n=1 Tax=Reticulomyxa filosa TaxID=46433 RepID=X6LNX8_RETFI|nr:hypothetical protein RFI_35026 [Reticulomyxa filosa]|eukprot:ETO02410.1 hypothetical protein RFI_35026 [Reticulomyxa filosa]